MHSTFALMLLRPREPVGFARQVEEHPQLPAATCERASGYGVVGLPFRSGHRFASGRLAPRTRAEWQTFVANPLRIWLVTSSHAVVHGEELGPIGRFLATSVAVEVPEAASVAR